MAGEISVNFGFYFYVKPQNVNGNLSSRLAVLVEPFDEALADKFTAGEDEMTHHHPSYASGWFGPEMMDTGELSDGDRWADFKVKNGDFSALQSEYLKFVADPNVVKLKAFMDERYGADSYEIRLGSYAAQSF